MEGVFWQRLYICAVCGSGAIITTYELIKSCQAQNITVAEWKHLRWKTNLTNSPLTHIHKGKSDQLHGQTDLCSYLATRSSHDGEWIGLQQMHETSLALVFKCGAGSPQTLVFISVSKRKMQSTLNNVLQPMGVGLRISQTSCRMQKRDTRWLLSRYADSAPGTHDISPGFLVFQALEMLLST